MKPGWVTSQDGLLYETKDSGKTWRELDVNGPQSGRVASCFFASNSLGWLVERTNDETNVRNTTDGGQHWQIQYSSKSRLDTVRFLNEQEGWAVGGIMVENYVRKSPSSVIHTTDQGKHWTEISDSLSSDVTSIYPVAGNTACA